MKKIKYCFALVILFVSINPLLAAQNTMPHCISKHYSKALIPTDRIKLITPDIAESGDVVSVGIGKIDSIPENNYVRAISLYNEFRNEPVATFTLSKKTLSTDLKTRIRLPKSSTIYAVARLDNGSLLGGKSFVKVTIGGCGGGGADNVIKNISKVCKD